jgi:hypothetical protein
MGGDRSDNSTGPLSKGDCDHTHEVRGATLDGHTSYPTICEVEEGFTYDNQKVKSHIVLPTLNACLDYKDIHRFFDTHRFHIR